MSTTPAFDLALFVGHPANLNDGVVVTALGPPFTAAFKPLVIGTVPGVVVGASTPAATAQNQIMISGPGPGFGWTLGSNPAVATTVPPPSAVNHVLMSDPTLTWQDTTVAALLAAGSAVVTDAGSNFTFDATSALTFSVAAVSRVRLDGSDPAFSQINNFSIDAGVF
jgi:hypothetical protein